MKKYQIACAIACLGLLSKGVASDAKDTPKIGVVNFAVCVEESKYGKQEMAGFEALKKQLVSLIGSTESQLRDLTEKFNDSEYMDGLSPEGEEELKNQYSSLSNEYNRYQQQYSQTLQQKNWQTAQFIHKMISDASSSIAKEKKLAMIVNKEACFFYINQLDITPLVISQMDKAFEAEVKNQVEDVSPELKAE